MGRVLADLSPASAFGPVGLRLWPSSTCFPPEVKSWLRHGSCSSRCHKWFRPLRTKSLNQIFTLSIGYKFNKPNLILSVNYNLIFYHAENKKWWLCLHGGNPTYNSAHSTSGSSIPTLAITKTKLTVILTLTLTLLTLLNPNPNRKTMKLTSFRRTISPRKPFRRYYIYEQLACGTITGYQLVL